MQITMGYSSRALMSFLILASLNLSKAKVWNRCEVLKELQALRVPEAKIKQYLCIAETESGLDSNHDSHVIVTGPLEGDPQCNHRTFGIFQIRSHSTYNSCYDLDFNPECRSKNPNPYNCNANCTDFLNDDLKDDVKCVEKILKTDLNLYYWSSKTQAACFGAAIDKINMDSTCTDIVQVENKLNLGFTGKSSESTIKTHNQTLVCVLNSLSHSRTSEQAKYDVDDVDPDLCTHLVYRAAVIDGKNFTVVSADHLQDTDEQGPQWFSKIPGLKAKHPHLKVLLSIGGWNAGVEAFQKVASDPKKRLIFIESAIQVLKKFKFDGVDMLWMWPALDYRGGKPQDKSDLTTLLTDMKKAFDEKNLILTITMNGVPEIIKNGYDLTKISKLVDHIHLLAIDYAGPWSGTTGHHSALYSPDPNKPSVANLVEFLISEKVPSQKLVLGIPFIGRTFLLKDASVGNGLGAPNNNGFTASFYPDNQEIPYNEICHELTTKKENWTFYRDTDARAPFAKSGLKWMSFDDPESIREKVEFGMCKDIKGFMAWSIDTDDFKGTNCNPKGVKYPLLRNINSVLTQLGKYGRKVDNVDGCAVPRFAGIPHFPKTKSGSSGREPFVMFSYIGLILWTGALRNILQF